MRGPNKLLYRVIYMSQIHGICCLLEVHLREFFAIVRRTDIDDARDAHQKNPYQP